MLNDPLPLSSRSKNDDIGIRVEGELRESNLVKDALLMGFDEHVVREVLKRYANIYNNITKVINK